MAEIYETSGTSGLNRNAFMGAVHWPSVIAGVFVTLALLIVAAVLGAAFSLETMRGAATDRNHGVGAAIWGIITALICFGIGGWVAGRNAYMQGRGSPMFNGILVWAVVVPLLTYGIGSIGSTVASQMSNASGSGDNAMPASARIDATGATTPSATANPASTDQATTHAARSAAWWTLFSLALGFVGAATMGSMVGDRSERRTTTTTTHPHT